MIDASKMLDCCKKCEYECKQHQWLFDDVMKMSGCIIADVEMHKIMEEEQQ